MVLASRVDKTRYDAEDKFADFEEELAALLGNKDIEDIAYYDTHAPNHILNPGFAPVSSRGGTSRRRKAVTSKKKPSAAPPSPTWVSTGHQTTLKDGSKRTVYRNSKTGARAAKRMVERDGKKSARYVKLG